MKSLENIINLVLLHVSGEHCWSVSHTPATKSKLCLLIYCFMNGIYQKACIPFYSIEKTELQGSLSLYPLRIILGKRIWLIKTSLKTHFISFKTVWNILSMSSLKDIDRIILVILHFLLSMIYFYRSNTIKFWLEYFRTSQSINVL